MIELQCESAPVASHEELAQNSFDYAFDASAAVVGGEIYLRGKNLYCIAEK